MLIYCKLDTQNKLQWNLKQNTKVIRIRLPNLKCCLWNVHFAKASMYHRQILYNNHSKVPCMVDKPFQKCKLSEVTLHNLPTYEFTTHVVYFMYNNYCTRIFSSFHAQLYNIQHTESFIDWLLHYRYELWLPHCWLSGKLRYLQHNCVGDTIVYYKACDVMYGTLNIH